MTPRRVGLPVRTIDENRYAQRFSPRKPKRSYSQSNIERLQALVKQKKVIKSVLDKLPELPSAGFKAPDDIIESIKLDEKAWKNFQKLSDSYKRIRIATPGGQEQNAFGKIKEAFNALCCPLRCIVGASRGNFRKHVSCSR